MLLCSMFCRVVQCVAVLCVLQGGAVCCSVCAAGAHVAHDYGPALHKKCVAVCCSMLQCVVV